jgi:cyanophycinase
MPQSTLVAIGGAVDRAKAALQALEENGISFDLNPDDILKNLPDTLRPALTNLCDSTGIYGDIYAHCGAKGHNVVCVTSASAENAARNAKFDQLAHRLMGADQVYTISNREEADSQKMADIIADKNTRMVFFDGGAQELLVKNFEGTKSYDALMHRYLSGNAYDPLLRKYVSDPTFTVAGSSAGAAAMSGKNKMIEDWNTEKNAPVITSGLGFSHRVIFETHLHRHENFPRLPRLQDAIKQCPDCMGMGLDEGTGVMIRQGNAEVLGERKVWTMAPEDVKQHHPRVANGEVVINEVYPSYTKGQTFSLGEHAYLMVPEALLSDRTVQVSRP